MSHEVPDNLLYTLNHEWLRRDEASPGEATVGITDFAQDQVGDVVYLDLAGKGDQVTAGERCGEIESTKTVCDLYSPISGEGDRHKRGTGRPTGTGQQVALRRGLDDSRAHRGRG